MARRFTAAARACVRAAEWETRRHGDHRIGTDHLLLGLLDRPGSVAAHALDVDLSTARTTVDALDEAAMHAVGVSAPEGLTLPDQQPTKGRVTLTAGARNVIVGAMVSAAAERARALEERHLLLALLGAAAPDPAHALLDALGVDREAARHRLAPAS